MAHRPTIDGEYPRVSQKTRCYELLDRLHDTPISQEAAVQLVQHLADAFRVRVGKVKFKPGHRGRARYKTRNILPSTPKLDKRRVGFLRTGLVIHEVAHLLGEQRGCKTHGDVFIMTLDELVHYASQNQLHSEGIQFPTVQVAL